MRFLADEGIDRQIVDTRRESGYSVSYVAETSPGIPDSEVLRRSHKREEILITSDKDFGELVHRQKRQNCGVILLRLSGINQDQQSKIVCTAFGRRVDEFSNAFTVITADRIRVRRKK